MNQTEKKYIIEISKCTNRGNIVHSSNTKECAERENIMKENNIEKKIRSAASNADQKLGKSCSVWYKLNKRTKILLMILAAVLMLLILPRTMKITMYYFYYILVKIKIFQVMVVVVFAGILVDEIQKNGMISAIARMLFIVFLLKIAGEMTGVDTEAIDMVLKWIANIPNLIANFLTSGAFL